MDTLSPCRSKSTWKPRVEEGDVPFFHCAGGMSLWLGAETCSQKTDMWRSAIIQPSYLRDVPCEEPTLASLAPVEIADGTKLHYQFTGGFDAPALEVFWDGATDKQPLWVALKTFTGIQVKYLTPNKRPPLVFALADEDAYCYCDHDPCEECVANCRRGFILYALIEPELLLKLPCGR